MVPQLIEGETAPGLARTLAGDVRNTEHNICKHGIFICLSFVPPPRDHTSQTALQLDILDAVPIAPDVTVSTVNVHPFVQVEDVFMRNPLLRPGGTCARLCLVIVVAC